MLSKKQNKNMKKKSKKPKKKNLDKQLSTQITSLTEEQKEFYLDQIKSLESRLLRYQKRCDELELMSRSYGDQFETLLKDKRDISLYLKKQLELRNEQVFDLNDRLIGLEQAKNNEKDFHEKKLQTEKEKNQLEIERLENENMILKTRLVGLEDFKYQRESLESTIEDLKNLLLRKEDAYKKSLEQMEIALIFFKDRLKNEAIEYLNDLAIEFRQNTKDQMSSTIKRAIQENVSLNNQITYFSNQLNKLIDTNRKTSEDNQHLTRTVAILEDLENQSAKKYFATENIIRMLCNKLKECQEQKQASIKETIFSNESLDKNIMTDSRPDEETNNFDQENNFIEIRSFKEENDLLKNIIQRAAAVIADIIQSPNDEDQSLNIEKRNEMFEQLLSILLTSHRLNGPGLLLDKKLPFLKGIYPGTRLGLHRISPASSAKTNTHYSLGDLGIVPSDQTTEKTLIRTQN